MAILNEYCLYHINQFLQPHDWVHVSQVCKLWKQATLRNWNKITKITIPRDNYPKDATIITTVDAAKTLLFAAPFVKVLSTEFTNEKETDRMNNIIIGKYWYRVANFEVKNILNLLAKKSTEITEVSFDKTPDCDLVKRLFERNNITKCELNNSNRSNRGLYQDIPTHTIEDLDITFVFAEDLVSFKGLFPSLTKLKLDIMYSFEYEDPRDILMQIMPYVPGLKYLDLIITSNLDFFEDPSTDLSDIALLSELEELKLSLLCSTTFLHLNSFLKQLPTCCPKLRVLKLVGYENIDEETFLKVLSLPQLESFECELERGFPSMELPEIKNLSELHIRFNKNYQIFTGLAGAVQKMRRLEKLVIQCEVPADVKRMLGHVFAIVRVAISLEKDVLITNSRHVRYRTMLRVTKLNNYGEAKIFDKSTEVLELSFEICQFKRLFDGVKKFVRNNLHSYNAFTLVKKM